MSKHPKTDKLLHFTFVLGIIAVFLYISIFLTELVSNNTNIQLLVQQFGHIGIFILSFIAGLNLFIPVPASTFTPVFTAGGISLPIVIAILVAGTMCANFVAYGLGRIGHRFTESHYPKLEEKINRLYLEKRRWLPYFVFSFAAFVPFPDEIYIIPLGLMGVRIKEFITPLILGTITFQTLTALGFQNVFQLIMN
ncbi:MAG: VTT domain-containing protein [Candidatus Nomurabacteria bacterium]|nr:VTT domain-containing protein [Candidatus Nomurabacteria bacterium]USN88154.1 MAG: VTT domain-containing protein [Candidatus Nomurabacteria bacterium]